MVVDKTLPIARFHGLMPKCRREQGLIGISPSRALRVVVEYGRGCRPGLGGGLRSSEGEFLKLGRQGDANRLKELTSDAGDKEGLVHYH